MCYPARANRGDSMLIKSEEMEGEELEIDKLLSLAKDIGTFETNEVLFEENDPGDSLYIILEGRVEISLLWEDGRRLGLDVMRPGFLFGEIALFNPGPRTATARTLEPCKLAQLRHDDLMAEIKKRPDLAVEILLIMGQRMRWMNQQLHEYVFMPLPSRLARKLLYLLPEGGGDGQRLRLSQTELADFAGATREAVSKTLSGWKKQGILATSRGSMEVLDRPSLRAIAGF